MDCAWKTAARKLISLSNETVHRRVDDMFDDIKEDSIMSLHSSSVLLILVDDTKGNTSGAQRTYYVSHVGSFAPGSDVVM